MAVTEDIDVFVSYSSKNKTVADSIVSDFEANGIKCWYAPRDWLAICTRSSVGEYRKGVK